MKQISKTKLGQATLGLFLLVALTTVGQVPLANSATAETVILVVNQAKVLAESNAGIALQEDATKLQETIATELKKEFDSIKKEEEQLIAQQTLLAADVLQERAQKLQVRKQNFQITQQVKQREYQASIAKARGLIAQAVEPIYTKIIEERKATIMVGRSQLIFASPDADVTAEVMKRLNDSTSKVAFERVKVEIVKPGENNGN